MDNLPSNKAETARSTLRSVAVMLVFLAAASLIGFLFRHIGFQDANIVVVYLLAVLLTAWLTQRLVFGILSSILATFLFYYFFVLPYFGFAVNDPNYWITFLTMLVTALVTSTLTSHAKNSALMAQKREAETRAMYDLTNRLANSGSVEEIISITVSTVSNTLSCDAACLCYGKNGYPEETYLQQTPDGRQVVKKTNDPQEIKKRMEALARRFDRNGEFYDWPFYGSSGILGIIRIPVQTAKQLNEGQLRLLYSMMESTAMAMGRLRSIEEQARSREETENERYRANLLRAISHDLRTPLSGIMGTSEMLVGMLETDEKKQLAEGIYKDADWLYSMVTNILSLTRLRDGQVPLEKSNEVVEEVVGGAVTHISKRNPGCEIDVEMPEEVLMLPMDARLIEQALINLLDNAVRHTPAGGGITVTVRACPADRLVEFTVSDTGSGIREEDLPRLFQQFYTTHTEQGDAKQGAGLGLAICDTIIKAHGGTIFARNRSSTRGAEFVFTLPMEDRDG